MASPAKPTGMSTEAYLGLGTALVVLSAIFAGVRLTANSQAKRLLFDDYIPMFAVLMVAGTHGIAYVSMKSLTDPTATLYKMAQLATAIDFLSGFAIWTSKAPILFLYIRLFGIEKWLRIVSYATLSVTFFIFLAGMAVVAAVCTPYTHDLDLPFILTCTKRSSTIGVTLGTTSVIADIIILAIPIPVIRKLRLPLHKKIGLFIVFLTGIFAIAASAVSLYYKWLSFKGTSTDLTSAMICTVIEACIAIIVGCVPATYSFWSTFVVNLPLYSKIKSVISDISITGRSRTGKTKHSKYSKESTGGRNDYINHRNSSHSQYAILEDGNSFITTNKSGNVGASMVPMKVLQSPR